MDQQREVIKRIEKKNFVIEFVKQDNISDNHENLYKVVADILYNRAMKIS
jgi:hypothetical protein